MRQKPTKTAHLQAAKAAKDDEFYTLLKDVEAEMAHYFDYLHGKVVFCPCDDFEKSNFARYFAENFENLGLKKLITSCFEPVDLFNPASPGGRFWIWDGKNLESGTHNGDFRSNSVFALAQQSDFIATNPPFSLFRAFFKWLIASQKDFAIIAAENSMHFSDVFSYFKKGKVFATYNKVSDKAFFRPDGTIKQVSSVWLTNLKIKENPAFLPLQKHFESGNYHRFKRYPEIINVDKLADIPCDFDGLMGVPITILHKINHQQFKIQGLLSGKPAQLTNKRVPYSRVLIRRLA